MKKKTSKIPAVDWEAQWAMHQGYRDGFVHVDLKKFASQFPFQQWPSLLKLAPGPGFGDLSHPTTRLVLSLMSCVIQNKHVIDVGCGSGILSFAAVAMGGRSVCGIDIDPEALIHAVSNAFINKMENHIHFCLPQSLKKISESPVILMNMIQSEQEEALKSLTATIPKIPFAITSGILSEGRAQYMHLCDLWGWKVIDEKEEEGWLGFVLLKKGQPIDN